LDSVEKVLGLARTMTYNGVEPFVHLVKGMYETGVKLTKKTMKKYEDVVQRMPNLEKWAVCIPCFTG
ncbi:MAG: ISAzo13 family transposase, partial [Proteobacteria bacterium]|nr:ISAzo13 family transposase [Pseudomonadota bacterium]